MSESTLPPRDPGDRELRRRLAELPDARLDGEVRAEMKRAFVEGRLKETGRGAGRTWLAVAAVAAVALVLVWVQHLGPGLRWEILEQPAVLAVDGVDYDAEGALDRALARGGVVHVPDGGGPLVVALERTLLLELTPGSTLQLPSPTTGHDPLRMEVDEGELRAMTGPDLAGRRLTVTTPEGRVEVTGTVFSVARNQDGTCVCVLEGRLQVGADEADLEPIPAGRRKVLFADGSPAKVTDAAPPHIQGLESFRSAWGPVMERSDRP